jgi:gamma-tubulin complex component 3
VSFSGEEGWEVFSLDYIVEAPISAVIHSAGGIKYSRMFHLLWRIKRVEWCVPSPLVFALQQ